MPGKKRFIADAPDDDGRMIAELKHHLPHLAHAAFLKRNTILLFRRIGIAIPVSVMLLEPAHSPENTFIQHAHALPVASIQKSLGMRVMGAADEIKPGVLHQPYITAGPGVRHGIPPPGVVLVHIGPLQINRFPVNQHAPVRRHLQSTEPQGIFSPVQHLPLLVQQFRRHTVHIGGRRAPQPGRSQRRQVSLYARIFPGPQFRVLLSPQHHAAALLLPHSMPHRHFPHYPGIILHFRQNPDLPAGRRHLRRLNPYSVRGQIHGRTHVQMHVPVQSSGKSMLPRPRRNAGAPAVIHPYLHPVLAGLQERRQIRPEGRIPPFMPSRSLPIHLHLRHQESCAAIQKHLLPLPFLRHDKLLAVGAEPRVKGIGHKVGQTERMGQMNRLPAALSGLVLKPELPAAIPDHPPEQG